MKSFFQICIVITYVINALTFNAQVLYKDHELISSAANIYLLINYVEK